MQTLKILIVGPRRSGKTSFLEALSEIGVVSTEASLSAITHGASKTRTISLGFGRTTLAEDLILYYFAIDGNQDTLSVMEILKQNHMFGSLKGLVVIAPAHNAVIPPTHDLTYDQESQTILRYVQALNCPYVVALSRTDVSDARTSQQMREVLSIPDEVKVLGYDLSKPTTTKQVALELLSLNPTDDLVQQAVAVLKDQG